VHQHIHPDHIKFYTAATMLDPRFKDGKEARLTVQELHAGGEYIIELACHLDQLRTARKAEMARDDAILGEQLPSQPQSENPYLQFAADLPDDGAVEEVVEVIGENVSEHQMRQELVAYRRSAAPVSVWDDASRSWSRDVWTWWRKMETGFPHIAFAARCMLSVPVATSCVERLFSFGGMAVDKRRCALRRQRAGGFIKSHMYSREFDGQFPPPRSQA
jgi:hypothetical protein